VKKSLARAKRGKKSVNTEKRGKITENFHATGEVQSRRGRKENTNREGVLLGKKRKGR